MNENHIQLNELLKRITEKNIKNDVKKYFTLPKRSRKNTKKFVQVLVPTATFKFRFVFFAIIIQYINAHSAHGGNDAKRVERRKPKNLLFKFTLSIYRNLSKKNDEKINTNQNECIYYTCHRVHLRHRREGPGQFIDLHFTFCTLFDWRILHHTVNFQDIQMIFYSVLCVLFFLSLLWIFMFFSTKNQRNLCVFPRCC